MDNEDKQPSLFDDGEIRGMVHRDDPQTSVEAARDINQCKTELHKQVLQAFTTHGPMNDHQLENLAEFRHYGPSTIRKRRSELYQAGRLRETGTGRNPRGKKMIIWGLNTNNEKQ